MQIWRNAIVLKTSSAKFGDGKSLSVYVAISLIMALTGIAVGIHCLISDKFSRGTDTRDFWKTYFVSRRGKSRYLGQDQLLRRILSCRCRDYGRICSCGWKSNKSAMRFLHQPDIELKKTAIACRVELESGIRGNGWIQRAEKKRSRRWTFY